MPALGAPDATCHSPSQERAPAPPRTHHCSSSFLINVSRHLEIIPHTLKWQTLSLGAQTCLPRIWAMLRVGDPSKSSPLCTPPTRP